jgi:DNA-binding NtrC family response regulator
MSAGPRILIAEDEDRLRRLLGILLNDKGYGLTLAKDGAEAWRLFQEGAFDLVVTDIRMPEMDGMQLLRAVKERSPETPVVVITAFGSIESAVEAMREGAVDYITKPFEEEAIKLAIERALRVRELLSENLSLRREVSEKYNLDGIVSESPQMRMVLEMARQVAKSNSTVLVMGESGTGKELVTRLIHEWSGRARGPFVAVNCAAIPESLLESELFGHEKGAFTGATDRRAGKFELASGGSLFLDEIGEMSLPTQAKVLRALETQEFERVGGMRTVRTDVRFITATNKDLREQVETGGFRGDLFFRVNVFPIFLPPLRDRTHDILPLARFFLAKFCREMGRRQPAVSRGAERMLLAHPWPGNVRELRNAIERATIMLDGPELAEGNLAPALDPDTMGFGRKPGRSDFVIPPAGFRLEEHERALLVQALERTGQNKSRAAKMLGISRARLRYRMEKFGIRDAVGPGAEK